MDTLLAGLVLTVTLLLILIRPGKVNEAWWAALSETAAGELLADAGTLIRQLRPRLNAKCLLPRGLPGEELVQAALEQRVDAVFIGRLNPGAGGVVSVSGTVKEWKRNRHGDVDGLFLEDGTMIGFPPHKTSEIRTTFAEGALVEASGERHMEHLHAYKITVPGSGASVEAHEASGKERMGRTARHVVDHSPCDVLLLRLLPI